MKPPSQPPQYEVVITDFHQGWLIEVQRLEGGFQSLCSSPTGEKLGVGKASLEEHRALYADPLQAQQKAIQLIDYFFASFAIKQILRELFEANKLSFDDWQALSHKFEPMTIA